ncbi:MAG: DUF2452 domain-containing protein [Pseudomonadota bacterium]
MSRNPHKNPNPQGKGTVPVLADWAATRPQAAADKSPAVLLLDWFVSAIVLSAKFQFRPALGQQYFLYLGEDSWQLSLIAPHEWGERAPGEFLGECALRTDMTWQIEPDEAGLQEPAIRERLSELASSFTESLTEDNSLREALPGYRRDLPYYQRMLATGLGSSLQASAEHLALLDEPADLLLEASGGALLRLVKG